LELSEQLNKVAQRVNELIVSGEIANNKKVKPQEQNEYYQTLLKEKQERQMLLKLVK
jgi:Icc-related predicted phosphoesterase